MSRKSAPVLLVMRFVMCFMALFPGPKIEEAV